MHSIAQRCRGRTEKPDWTEQQKEQWAWRGHVRRSNHAVLKRRQRKKVLHEFAQLFNKGYKKEEWINYLIARLRVSSHR